MILILSPSSARKSILSLLLFLMYSKDLTLSCFLYCRFLFTSDEEEVPVTDVAPRTSTSRTVLVSDTLVEGDETSSPQQNVVTTTPPSSPLVPSPKRARVEMVVEPPPQLGSSSSQLLDDVSLSRSIFPLFCFCGPLLL
jgi:hypothetical protein